MASERETTPFDGLKVLGPQFLEKIRWHLVCAGPDAILAYRLNAKRAGAPPPALFYKEERARSADDNLPYLHPARLDAYPMRTLRQAAGCGPA